MNLPNSLTLARIFLVPFVVVLLLTTKWPIHNWAIWCVSVFLGAALTDLFDGYLARRRKQVTTLGRLLDPIADKLLISSALVSLVQLGCVRAWMVAIILGREFAVNGLRSIAASEGLTIDASPLGKGKMVLQVAAVVGLILGRVYKGWIQLTADALMYAVVLIALVSMVQYFLEFWSKLDISIKHREHRRLRILERKRLIMAERRELKRLRRLERRRSEKVEAQTPTVSSLRDSS